MSAIHIGDTGLFVAMGDIENRRYRAVRTFAHRNKITFVLPERVYEELTATRSADRTLPIDAAIDDGWVRVADPLDYSMPLVSRVMDGVQRYIANADDRPEDEIERADAALPASLLTPSLMARPIVHTSTRRIMMQGRVSRRYSPAKATATPSRT